MKATSKSAGSSKSRTVSAKVAFDRQKSVLAKCTASGKSATKSEIVSTIALKLSELNEGQSELVSKKQIALVIDEFAKMISLHLVPTPDGPGRFTIPGLLTLETKVDKKTSKTTLEVRPFKRLNDVFQ